MYRTIAATALAFAFAVFALRRSSAAGRLEEPLLLLVMGAAFLIVGKLVGPASRRRTRRLPAERELRS